jgi:carboxyl-terminal processing protease
MKGLPFVGATAFAAFCATFVTLHLAYGAYDADQDRVLDRFGDAYAIVHAKYVDAPDDVSLVEGAISGMLSSLDAHSSYFDPKTFADIQVTTQGEYAGVGLLIGLDKAMIKVISPIDNSPGSRAGIKADDTILAIDGKPISGFKLDDVQALMRGPAGTKITLSILRADVHDPFDVKLVRAVVAVEPVTWRREGDVGYIRMPAFNEHTADGLDRAVRELKQQIGPSLKGFILDLRNNGGGVLDGAIAVSDDFLEGGEIVSTRGRTRDDTQRWDAHPGDIAGGKPLIVLINGASASASEIVAGALQDHQRARIVGEVSFGKGSVQTVIPLDGGAAGALHMTTARYYTPSGHSIQTTGIIPDIEVVQGPDEAFEVPDGFGSEAMLPHHLEAEEPARASAPRPKIEVPAGQTFKDFQLTYAIGLLDGTQASQAKAKPHA